MTRKPHGAGAPIRCALCRRCWERLDDAGRPTGGCLYGGPYAGVRGPWTPAEIAAARAAAYGPSEPPTGDPRCSRTKPTAGSC